MRPYRRLLAALLLLAALGGALAATVEIRTDLAEFLPPGRSRASEFLFRELRSGAATSLLLAGIEGAPPEELARLSRETGAALRASGAFAFVGDGTTDLGEAERAFLFRYRYLLSPETVPEAFTAPALRARLEALLDGLRSAAAPLLARFGFADPTGAFLGLARNWLGESRLERRDGAWFAPPPSPPRVLLLARGRGAGLDAEAQARAVAAFRAAFAAARPGAGARLLLSGPGVFAAEAAASIRADVERITLLSGVLLAGFLLWRTRSLALLGLVAVPLLAATIAGAAVVALAYGAVHGIALGFGMTMLGVAVDYPILLVTLRRPREALGAAAARIWPTLRLAALSAVAGLAAMLGSGFTGLVQLGLFAGTGLLAAAGVTRWVLPWLLPEVPLAVRPLPPWLARALLGLRGRRGLAAAVVGAAALLLLPGLGGPRWERDLAALSPVPREAQALDAELRRQLGAPDVRHLIAIGPGNQEAVLRASERLEAAIAPLVARGGVLAGLDLPSRYLPSRATQQARQAALPEAAALAERLREAAAGLPFRPTAFAPFLDGVAESRTLPPLDDAALAANAPTIAARLSPLLSPREGGWQGLGVASGVTDPAALAAAVAELDDPALLFVDTKAETEAVLAATACATVLWAGAGAILVLALLALGLGGVRPALRAAAPIAGALVLTLAALAASGQALTLFHLASLLLLAGVSIDYALFLNRSSANVEDAGPSMGAVLNCAVCTLLTFGLLALCRTPVLHGIGFTVTTGVAAAFLLACAMAGGAAPRDAAGAPGSAPRA